MLPGPISKGSSVPVLCSHAPADPDLPLITSSTPPCARTSSFSAVSAAGFASCASCP